MRSLLAVLILLTGCTVETLSPPAPAPSHGTGIAVYPVLLLAPDRYYPILCVCKTPAQLRLRKETELTHLQSDAFLIDAAGTRFRLRHVHSRTAPRNELVRLLFPGPGTLEVDLRLHPEGPSRNADAWEASHTHHYNFRLCGLSANTPVVELLRGFSNKNCVWPPL